MINFYRSLSSTELQISDHSFSQLSEANLTKTQDSQQRFTFLFYILHKLLQFEKSL